VVALRGAVVRLATEVMVASVALVVPLEVQARAEQVA
jgi:hypothetical protein